MDDLSMAEESTRTMTRMGENVSEATKKSDEVNIEIHGNLLLYKADAYTKKGLPTTALGYDPKDSETSSE